MFAGDLTVRYAGGEALWKSTSVRYFQQLESSIASLTTIGSLLLQYIRYDGLFQVTPGVVNLFKQNMTDMNLQ